MFWGAAFFLTLAVWAIVIFCRNISPGRCLNELAHRMNFTGKIVDNFAFRTVIFTYLSLGMNILFALAMGIAGCFSASWWLITLSVYYIILCIAKFILLKDSRKLDKLSDQSGRIGSEWKAYRACGVLLLSMTLVLFGVVVLIMEQDSKFTYYGTLIFAVALWVFYNFTMAIIYIVRNRGKHTPIIVAIKMLKFATALVSMLSLQTAMFASFGGGTATQLKQWMNLATGSAVCIIIFGVGLYMVIRANKRLKEN